MKPTTITLICEECGKEFERRIYDHTYNLKKGRKIFCSKECSNKGTREIRTYNVTTNRCTVPPPIQYKDPETVAFKYMLTKARKNAKQCERKVLDLTLENLKEVWDKQNHICVYSGVDLVLPIQYKSVWNNPTFTASLDRIDSSKGYVVGNIQFVSIVINRAKGNFTHEQMIEFCNIMKR